MLIQTKYLGEIEIKQEKIVHFEKGVPGFELEKEFVLLDIYENDLLQIMQSIKNPDLAFFVASPYQFYDDYSITLNEQLIEQLTINDEKEVVVLTIITLKDPFSASTVNLKAPIIINSANMQGKQFILNDDTYSMRTPLPPKSNIESGV